MSAYALLFGKFALQGWSIAAKLDICMEFIDQITVGGTFDEFLKNKAYDAHFDDMEEKLDEEEIE